MNAPPRLTACLVNLLLSPEHDSVIGDMEEAYFRRLAERGALTAAMRFRIDALKTIPHVLVSEFILAPAMHKNYLLTTCRNLMKYKGFSAINIAGLAISMAACLMIITLVKDQRSYDDFHPRVDDLYRVTSTVEVTYGTSHLATSPGPLGEALARESPFVERVARMRRYSGHLGNKDRAMEMNGLYAEPEFFELFAFPLERGSAESALDLPYSLVLSRSAANRLFPDRDPLGEILRQDSVDYTVTGVFAVLPNRTHLDFDALVSFSTLERAGQPVDLEDWDNATQYYTYLRLVKGADVEAVLEVAAHLLTTNHTTTDHSAVAPGLQPVRAINLGEELSNQVRPLLPVTMIYAFIVFGLLLVATAVFNYMSLSVARSLKRAREIGIRKAVGAHRGQLVRQFLSEAVLVSILALGGAMILLTWLVPSFNALSVVRDELGITVTADWFGDTGLFGLFFLLAVGVGLLAGLYPAVVMSRFTPSAVLKGSANFGGISRSTLRKILIVAQFKVAIVGIVVTMVMHRQFSNVLTHDYGFDKEHLVLVDLQGRPYSLVRDAFDTITELDGVTGLSTAPVVGGNWKSNYRSQSMEEDGLIRFYATDGAFTDLFHVAILAGRNLISTDAGGDPNAVLINRKALAAFGFDEPADAVGESFQFSDSTVTVAGVVEDFSTSELEKGNEPTILTNRQDDIRSAVVRIRGGETAEALSALEDSWRRIAPTYEFDYSFFDDQMKARFSGMQDMFSVIGLVVGFIVFIACLGLLGMASYATEARSREIGVRKVVGASNVSVVFLISRDYLKLVLIASVIGLPIAWFLANLMLQEFADRIPLHAGYFLMGVVGTLALALITVGSQTARAGRMNPVDTLRVE